MHAAVFLTWGLSVCLDRDFLFGAEDEGGEWVFAINVSAEDDCGLFSPSRPLLWSLKRCKQCFQLQELEGERPTSDFQFFLQILYTNLA